MLAHQACLAHKGDRSRTERRASCVCRRQPLRLPSIERSQINTGRFWISINVKKEMAAIGQKPWMPMLILPRCQSCHGNRLASRSRNTRQRTEARSKEDRTIRVPRAAPCHGRVGQDLRRSARNIDSLEFACCSKSDRTAVRGPEGIIGAFASRHRSGFGFT
jgi:hypothetical protein